LSACTPANRPGDAGVGGDDDAGVDAGAGGEIVPASEYCEAIAPFFCRYYLRCDRMAGVTTQAECESVFDEQCNGRYEPRYVGLEGAGLLTLSRAGLDACEAHLGDVPCAEQIRDLDGPCADLWVGQQPTGGACGFDVESFVCEPGSECSLSLDLCGECRRVVEPGQPCGGATEESVTCGAAASCVDGACVARVPVGQSCGPDDSCVLGARCESGTCAAPNIVGVSDACDIANRCPYKSHCEGGVCVEDALIGDGCVAPVGCASGWCASDGVCQALFAPGADCEESAQCSTGVCDQGRCVTFPGRCFAG
jgi:hypothetical protein